MYTYMHTHTRKHTHTKTHRHTHAHTHIDTHVHTYARYTQTDTYPNTRVIVSVDNIHVHCMYVYACIYIQKQMRVRDRYEYFISKLST